MKSTPQTYVSIPCHPLEGDLQLIARTGSALDIDDGPGVDMRTIHELWFTGGSGNQDGRASGFNDLGQLAFMAKTTGKFGVDWGIYVTNAVAIPEPSLLLIVAAGLPPCVLRCRIKQGFES